LRCSLLPVARKSPPRETPSPLSATSPIENDESAFT
jgi:hypothetical protein